MAFVGLDIGGQSVKAAIVDSDGTELATASAPTGPDTDARRLSGIARDLLAELARTAEPEGPVGVGIAGVLSRGGTLDGSPHLRALEGTAIGDIVARGAGRPATVDNDANCAALAEGWTGAARGRRDFLLVTLGTGLGSGLVLGGNVFQGSTGHGCELGHSIIVYQGRTCGCGNRGCLEAYVSETAVRGQVEEGGGELAAAVRGRVEDRRIGWSQALFELADQGSEAAEGLAGRMADHLGVGLASVINVLDLSTVVLGGGIAPAFLARRERLVRAMGAALFARAVADVEVLAATGGPLAGAIGAARLAMLSR